MFSNFNQEKIKTFVLYTVFITLMTLILLIIGDLLIEFYFGTFNFEAFLREDVPVNLYISVAIALGGWFFNDKRLKAKNKRIELNLSNKDGKKED